MTAPEPREARETTTRGLLAQANLDGPIEVRGGDGVLGMLVGCTQVAVCTICGALVLLGDPMERPGQSPVERGVYLHTTWHEEHP